MLKINVSKLNSELIDGIKILSCFYAFKIDDGGIVLTEDKITDGFEIISDGKRCTIKYSEKVLFFTAFSYLLQYKKCSFSIKRQTIARRGIMRDSARNGILSVNGLKELATYSALLGYNYIQIYSEDLLDLDKYPYFGCYRGKYTKNEIKEMDDYCRKFGIELIPCIQTLAHLSHLFRYDAFDDVHDIADILLTDDENTYKLIETMIDFAAENFSSREINIGMDEAHLLGQGKYAEKFGDKQDRSDIFFNHLNKVAKICRSKGLKPSIWSDMVFKVAFDDKNQQAYTGVRSKITDSNLKHKLPENVKLIFWDYYHTEKNFYDEMFFSHYQLTDDIAFAGGAWTWSGFAPLNTVAENRLEPAILSVIENKCNDFLLTSWGDGGGECLCMNMASTMLFVAERLQGETEIKQLNERAKIIFGNSYEELKNIEIVNRTNYDSAREISSVCNPSKYLLYNDLFLGIMDAHTRPEMAKAYEKNSKILKKTIKNGNKLKIYIEPIYRLSRCLEIKSLLGVELYKAYKDKNIKKLKYILHKTLPKCIWRMDKFFEKYRKAYLNCNKNFGSEVMDIRFGGMKKRLENIKGRLSEYIEGKAKIIEELERKRFTPRSFDEKGKDIEYNSFSQSFTGGKI